MKTFAMNGNWITETDHLGRSQALQFGAGLFETIRIQDNEPLFWYSHMDRLKASAAALGLSEGLDTDKIKIWTDKLLRDRNDGPCALKILWVPDAVGGKALFYFRPSGYTAEQRAAGLKVRLGEIRRNPFSRITAHKTTNYLDNLLERNAAKAAGYDESILLNVRGNVAEGTATNIFIMKNGQLLTPPPEDGLLPGIQRKAIIDICQLEGIPIVQRTISLEMAARAEGIYLSNSLMGFISVSNFMGNCYDKEESLVRRINRLTGISDKL